MRSSCIRQKEWNKLFTHPETPQHTELRVQAAPISTIRGKQVYTVTYFSEMITAAFYTTSQRNGDSSSQGSS